MKKITLLIAFLLLASVPAYATHLVCDPNPGLPDSYVFTGLPAPLTSPATGTSIKADGSLFLDISNMPVGSYPLTVKACKTDPIWGQACSAAVPFTLVRPTLTSPTPPANLNITQ
jgi:hypothetical protein